MRDHGANGLIAPRESIIVERTADDLLVEPLVSAAVKYNELRLMLLKPLSDNANARWPVLLAFDVRRKTGRMQRVQLYDRRLAIALTPFIALV